MFLEQLLRSADWLLIMMDDFDEDGINVSLLLIVWLEMLEYVTWHWQLD